jgi:hypothetical protein
MLQGKGCEGSSPATTKKEDTMKTAINLANLATEAYVVTLLTLVGAFAAISAVLIAWPALAYIGAKLF